MPEDTQLQAEKWTRLLIVVSTLLVLMIFVAVVIHLSLFIHHTLLLFSLGALVAYALDPLVEALRRGPGRRIVERLRRRRPIADGDKGGADMMPRGAAITIVFVGVLLVIGFSVYALARPLTAQVRLFSDKNLQQRYKQRADEFLKKTDIQLGKMGEHVDFEQYLSDPSTIPENVKADASNAERDALIVLRDFAVSIGESFFVLLIALYLLIYGGEMREKINAQLPANLRRSAVVWEEDVNRILGGFVRGQLLLALVMGAAAAIGCIALGIHIWLLIGIFVAIASLIPVFGPYLGAIPAIIAALIGPTHIASPVFSAVAVIVLFVVINEIGSKVLYPRLVGQAIGLHEVLVLFVIIAGLEIDGIVGVLFAAPLTAIIMVTLVHLYRFWLDLPDSLLSARNEAASKGRLATSAAGGAGSGGKEVSEMRKTVEG